MFNQNRVPSENGKFPHAGGGFKLDCEHTRHAKTDYKQLPPRLAEAGGFGSTPTLIPHPRFHSTGLG